MFPRTLALYREMGFRFVSLEEAQNHPAYAGDNDPAAAPVPDMYAMMQAEGFASTSRPCVEGRRRQHLRLRTHREHRSSSASSLLASGRLDGVVGEAHVPGGEVGAVVGRHARRLPIFPGGADHVVVDVVLGEPVGRRGRVRRSCWLPVIPL